MGPKPLTLEDELSALTQEERAAFAVDEDLRQQAHRLAEQLGLDASDVHHILKQLGRSPTERLRRGLTHGRRRPRVSH